MRPPHVMDWRGRGDGVVHELEIMLSADNLDGHRLQQHQSQRVSSGCVFRPVRSLHETQSGSMFDGRRIALDQQDAPRPVGQHDGIAGPLGKLVDVLDERHGDCDKVLLPAQNRTEGVAPNGRWTQPGQGIETIDATLPRPDNGRVYSRRRDRIKATGFHK